MKLELKDYEELIPVSDYLKYGLVKNICIDMIEQINYYLTSNDIEDLDYFEYEINHGYHGGLLFMYNSELAEHLDLLDRAELETGELIMYNLSDVYQKVADGVYYEANEIAAKFVSELVDELKSEYL